MVGGVGIVTIVVVEEEFKLGFKESCVVFVGAVGTVLLLVSDDVAIVSSLNEVLVVTINGGVGMVIKLDDETLFKHSSLKPGTHDDDAS